MENTQERLLTTKQKAEAAHIYPPGGGYFQMRAAVTQVIMPLLYQEQTMTWNSQIRFPHFYTFLACRRQSYNLATIRKERTHLVILTIMLIHVFEAPQAFTRKE